MSDLPGRRALQPNATQLPVTWYFDDRVFELEKKLLFDTGPGYVGHELMVPEPGDYQSLAWRDHGQVLIRNNKGVQLLSNVCRHRQSLLLQGRGNVQNIVCPVHRWTYDIEGHLLGAPHFPGNPCLDLASTPLQNWHGLLFEGSRNVAEDLAGCGVAPDLSSATLTAVKYVELVESRSKRHKLPLRSPPYTAVVVLFSRALSTQLLMRANPLGSASV